MVVNDSSIKDGNATKKELFFLISKFSDVMYHILVIDDEKATLDAFKIELSKAGFKVEIASDSQEGIQIFDSSRFDLVITDIYS